MGILGTVGGLVAKGAARGAAGGLPGIALGIGGSIVGSMLGSLIERTFRGEFDPEQSRAVLRRERMKHIYEKTGKGMSLQQAMAETDQEIEDLISQKEQEYNNGGNDSGVGSTIGR
jgi:hypothetical protein